MIINSSNSNITKKYVDDKIAQLNAEDIGALSADTLDSAIDMALLEAKNSGEFKGDPGPAGANGKTPVKGTDYYTEADKTEMVNRVINALPTWTGGNY